MQIGDLVRYIPREYHFGKTPPQQYRHEGAMVIGIVVAECALGRWWNIRWRDGSIDNRVSNELEVING
tara:strand:- start:521 stop:724 length:204 start_codon:yes stop_codon:yes gene_type:complete